MNPKEKINRKVFLRLLSLIVSGLFIYIWAKMTGEDLANKETDITVRLNPSELGTDIYFYDKFILVKTEKVVKVFSNKCTHAGCRISQQMGNELQCSCHGSRFDSLTGKVTNGPAQQPLQSINYTTDTNTGEILITI